MSDYDVRPAKKADLWFVARTMRLADRKEVKASHGSDPLGALIHSYTASDLCYTLTHLKLPLCVFGRAPLTVFTASVWMLGTIHLKFHSRAMLKLTPTWLEILHRSKPFLVNAVHPDNHASLRWLKWAGAAFGESLPNGFLPFVHTSYQEQQSCVK